MCYPHVYVACVNIGYNKEQYIKALQEANNHNGPSIIIAYAPCIEHGIKTGMEHSLDDWPPVFEYTSVSRTKIFIFSFVDNT